MCHSVVKRNKSYNLNTFKIQLIKLHDTRNKVYSTLSIIDAFNTSKAIHVS